MTTLTSAYRVDRWHHPAICGSYDAHDIAKPVPHQGFFASFRPSVVHAPDTGLESNPVFLDISRKTNDIMYHTRSCKRLHELVWPSVWPHHGQIGQNHAGVAQLRNEGTRRPAASAKNRDAELRMIPRKSSATPVTFANSPRPCSYGHAMHDQPAGLTAVPRRQAARSASGSLQAQK